MFFIQRLCKTKRGLGRKSETRIGFALQRREIKQQWRRLRGWLGFFLDDPGLAEALRDDRTCFFLVPKPLGTQRVIIIGLLEFFIEPAARIIARNRRKGTLHFPVIAWPERFDFFFALDHDGQRRCLYAADCGELKSAGLGIERGHRARAIDADQPIRFGTAYRRIGKRLIGRAVFQFLEAVANRALRHRLQPQAFDRLLGLGVLHDVAKNEFALASRVAGVDQAIDIFALQQPLQRLQPIFGFLDGSQCEVRRYRRQMIEGPLTAFDFLFFRHGDFHQMADRGRQHVIVAFKEVFLFGEPAQRLGNIVGNGGFFGDDQGLAHRVDNSIRSVNAEQESSEKLQKGQMISRDSGLPQAGILF